MMDRTWTTDTWRLLDDVMSGPAMAHRLRLSHPPGIAIAHSLVVRSLNRLFEGLPSPHPGVQVRENDVRCCPHLNLRKSRRRPTRCTRFQSVGAGKPSTRSSSSTLCL